MIREDQQFFYADGSSQDRPEKPGAKLRREQNRRRHNAWLADRVQWSDGLQEQWRVQDEKALRDAQRPRSARPKRRVRRLKPRVLRELRHSHGIYTRSDDGKEAKEGSLTRRPRRMMRAIISPMEEVELTDGK
ncbi:hypothetical protein [Sulfobacillus harzensis]|uniref:Uncharacterized protein n=1 Tax=Sulfobacillus harzensis TaxID=2729629 RepID=A0A7Y0L7Q3_9FIRM|nr:hypothetical protein [Sulfobacillus harzensis]NMP24745.1 hypothetical protein [Sulfobacillus harzensis]